MKKIINLLVIFPLFFAGCSSSQTAQNGYYYEDNRSHASTVTYQTFYDQLGPYGTWVDYPGYGYVWRPGVGGDFTPYATNGRWISTTDGWAWASDYSWGWAPFHYGRWLYDAPYGWLWVPGYEWAPAWVVWGQYNNYYGWAPLAPGININISIGGGWRPPYNYWSFVPNNCINYRNLNGYIVRNSPSIVVNNVTIINNSNGGNRRYDRGPAYNDVERYTRSRITPVDIVSSRQPGRERTANNRFEVYRPTINNAENSRSASPRNVRRLDDIRGNATSGNTNSDRRNPVDIGNNNQTTDAGNRPVRRYENRRDPSVSQQNPGTTPTDIYENRRVFERRQREQQTNQQANPSDPATNDQNRPTFERRQQREQQANQQTDPSASTQIQENRRVFERRQREINQQTNPTTTPNENRREFETRRQPEQAPPATRMPQQQSSNDNQQMRRSFPSNSSPDQSQQPVRQYRPAEGAQNGSPGRSNRNQR